MVGVLGVLSGSFYMYKNRTGDSIGKLEKSLINSLIPKTRIVGSIDIETKVTTMKPSTRELGVEVTASREWEQFTANVKISALAHEKLADISTMGSITVPLSNNMVAGIGVGKARTDIPVLSGAARDLQTTNTNMFLTLQYQKDNLSVQLRATTDDENGYAIGTVLHLEF